MSDTPEVLVRREGAVGWLSLNRPRAIHALTLPMVHAITAALLDWAQDPAVAVVVIDHATSPDGDPRLNRGFCAGGDVALLRRSALEDGGAAARAFFFDEYRLNHLLMTYAKPVVAFLDGITMGGGVGISGPAVFRVATPATRLAMPETGIGLFPDVGGGWYLSRLAGALGEYLALTGARLDGAECLWAGLATHFLGPDAVPLAKARLVAGEDPAAVLAALTSDPGPAKLAEHSAAIDRLFGATRLIDTLAALDADGGEWALAQAALLRTRSPLSCDVSLALLAASRALPDFAAEMALEYRIAGRMVLSADFAEGVRAVLVDKDNAPRWTPADPAALTPDLIASYLAPLPAAEEWSPL